MSRPPVARGSSYIATPGRGFPMEQHDAKCRSRFRRRLKTWFAKNARDLPWRRTRDPYAVWVSEIMLQQTQVEMVKAYFNRFVEELPNVKALAKAKEERVLRLWEGLGYYRRARQMHKAAQVVVAEYDGEFPRDVATLQKLPGIGRYTAGAIASIAFDERAPILEANTIRLFARLLAYRGEPTSAEGQRLLWSFAEEILPQKGVGQFNQALMEFGALVCTPKTPACHDCPVMSLCPTFADGLQDNIPRPKRKIAFEEIHEAAVIVRDGQKVLLRRCGDAERWAGLWDFPRVAVSSDDESQPGEVAQRVAQQIGGQVRIGQRLKTIRHGVTRYRITLACYEGRCDARRLNSNGTELKWIAIDKLESIPLSTTGRKLAKILDT